MKVLMLVNWKIEYVDKAPEDKQPPDYFIKGRPYWFFRYFPDVNDWQVDVVDISSFPALEHFEKDKIRFYVWQTLKVLPKLNRYDLVLSHGMQSGIVLCLFRRLFGKGRYKHIVFDIGGFNSAREEGRALKLMQFASKSLDGVIYHTKRQIEYYRKCHPWLLERSGYIAFGTDTEYFQPTGEECDRENPYILCVGYHKRDWDTLLKAYEILREKWKGLEKFPHLKLIGRKELGRKYEGVDTVSTVPIKELIAEIERAAFCILPLESFLYSFGQMTLLQQMLLEKAVIVADVPSVHEYISDGSNGLFYKPQNVPELIEKMKELIENPEICKELGTHARKSVVEHWNEKKMAEEIYCFFGEILNR